MTHQSGIWGHSSAAGNENYIIFCVGKEPRVAAAFRIWVTAMKLPFKSLKGRYNGVMEDSFIMREEDFQKVKHWAANEETVLLLGPCDARDRRPAKLIHKGGGIEHIGMFRACSKNEALFRPSWTYDPSLDLYFVAA